MSILHLNVYVTKIANKNLNIVRLHVALAIACTFFPKQKFNF